MRRFVLLVTCSLVLSSVAQAGRVVPGNISQDAKWFGHVNIEAIHSLEVVQEFQAKMDKDDRFKENMREMAGKIGLNPMEDLLAVTIYATQYEGDVGVGLFYVKKVDAKKMVALLKKEHPDHETSRYGDRTLYSWTVKHRRGEMKLTGTFASKKLIIVGAGEEHVKAALDVLDGEKPGLTKDSPLLAGASKRSLFVSNALDVPDDYRETTKCPILRKCTTASVNWTEKKGTITAKYVFTAESEKTANGFKGIIDAATAMGRMRAGKMEAVEKMMAGLQYKVKGEVFTLTWKTTIDDIRAAVNEAMESWGHSRDRYRDHRRHGDGEAE